MMKLFIFSCILFIANAQTAKALNPTVPISSGNCTVAVEDEMVKTVVIEKKSDFFMTLNVLFSSFAVAMSLISAMMVYTKNSTIVEEKKTDSSEVDHIVYGEHDKSFLPDTPLDVVNQRVSEVKKISKDNGVSESLSIIQKLTNGVDQYCESSSAPMSDLMSRVCKATQDTNWDKLFHDGELKYRMVVGCLSGHLEGVFLKQMASIMKGFADQSW